MQDFPLLVAGISEMYVFETDALVKRRQLDGVPLLLHLVLRIQEVEDLLRGTQRLLEIIVELPELAHRLIQLKDRDDEGNEKPLAHVAVLDAVTSQQDQERDGDGAKAVHQRGIQRKRRRRTQVRPEQAPRGVAEAPHLPRLHAERLDHADAGDGFMQQIVNFCQLVLAFARGGANAVAYPARRCDY